MIWPRVYISETDRALIPDLFSKGETIEALVKRFGVSAATVYRLTLHLRTATRRNRSSIRDRAHRHGLGRG